MNDGNNSGNGSKKALVTQTAQVEPSDLVTINCICDERKGDVKIIVAFQIYQSPGSQQKSECQSEVLFEEDDGKSMIGLRWEMEEVNFFSALLRLRVL